MAAPVDEPLPTSLPYRGTWPACIAGMWLKPPAAYVGGGVGELGRWRGEDMGGCVGWGKLQLEVSAVGNLCRFGAFSIALSIYT